MMLQLPETAASKRSLRLQGLQGQTTSCCDASRVWSISAKMASNSVQDCAWIAHDGPAYIYLTHVLAEGWCMGTKAASKLNLYLECKPPQDGVHCTESNS